MYFVGIDWADTKHQICILNRDGKELANFAIAHTRKGLEQLREKLNKLCDDPAEIACIIETKHGLLINSLLEFGYTVYPVNPKIANRRRKPSGAKSDALDARILAEIGRTSLHELRALTLDDDHIEELKALTRDLKMLINESTRLQNRLTSCLKEYYPVALDLFSRVGQNITLQFLKRYPNLAIAREASAQELEQFLREFHYPNAAFKADEIYRRLHKPQLIARPYITKTKMRLALALVKQLEVLLEQIAEYDAEVAAVFHAHSESEIFASLPAAGKRLAPRMLAEWGSDRNRFAHHSMVQALAGTSPVIYQSGKYCTVRQRKACIKPFRDALHQFALQTRLEVDWCKEYYHKKRADGKKHHEAARMLANIWVRIIFRMWQNHETYDEAKFLAARRKHSRKAA